ncbi:hypothetical protein MMC29_004148, partial [Sticta canariensis]|nr:hypothetical protein [Sticta canariensis]
MPRTGVAHEDFFVPDHMVAASIGGAWVDGMTVINAAADRIALGDSYAHVGCLDSLVGSMVVVVVGGDSAKIGAGGV